MENFIFCTMLKQILHFMCLNPSTDSNDEFIYLIAFYKDQMFTTKTRWRFQLPDVNGHRENSPIYIEEGVLQNRTPSSIQLHPAHFNLHPAHFNVQPALCNTLNNIQTKISHLIGQFPQVRPKTSKLSISTENWHTWYLKDADSYSNINFLKFRPQNQILGKCGPKKSKLSVLPEHWHTTLVL